MASSILQPPYLYMTECLETVHHELSPPTAHDEMVQLREWGTERTTPLAEIELGFDVRVVRDHGRWLLLDHSGDGELSLDGIRRDEVVLDPGSEIGVGGVTLVAESRLSIALRRMISRMLGWGPERCDAVDHALRSIRMAATRRAELVIRGDGDLVPIARAIHRRAFGADLPFVLCDPRRRPGGATVRSAENYETGMRALAAASGGTLCVRRLRPPPDFEGVLERIRHPDARVRLVVCASPAEIITSYLAPPIVVPALSSRPDEVDRVITEYAVDAMDVLGVPAGSFLPADLEWVRMHSATSLPDIEKATLRLVAIRESRNLSNAASRLGMAPVSLARWLDRHRMPRRCAP